MTMEFGAIFDMDGVLVDSHDIIWACHNKALAPLGVQLSEADIKRYTGRSFRDLTSGLNEQYGLTLNSTSLAQASWALQRSMLEKIEADSALVALLTELKAHNVPMGVGTSSQRFRVEQIVGILNLNPYFPVLVTADDVQKHKPHPDVFLEVARRIGMAPERCVVFEDAVNGVISARNSRAYCIAVANSFSEKELKYADLVVNSLKDINVNLIALIGAL